TKRMHERALQRRQRLRRILADRRSTVARSIVRLWTALRRKLGPADLPVPPGAFTDAMDELPLRPDLTGAVPLPYDAVPAVAPVRSSLLAPFLRPLGWMRSRKLSARGAFVRRC